MNTELENLLSYLEEGYILAPAEGKFYPLARKLSETYDVIMIYPSAIREGIRNANRKPNEEHL